MDHGSGKEKCKKNRTDGERMRERARRDEKSGETVPEGSRVNHPRKDQDGPPRWGDGGRLGGGVTATASRAS